MAEREFQDLVDVVRRLRVSGGCPWDREQAFETVKPMTVEEAYEVIEAIDAGAPTKIADDVGDLLFHVVF